MTKPKTSFHKTSSQAIFSKTNTKSNFALRKLLLSIVVSALLAVMAFQMLSAAHSDGSTSDEQIHILSGYTTLTQAHVLFDPEHPFLAKALAALPLLFIRPNVPTAAAHLTPRQAEVGYDTYKEANQWGYQMIFNSGNNADQLLFVSRAIIALLTVLLALAIFLWTKSLFGTASALAALVIIAFEPSFIAHGHLANDDTVASLFFLSTIASFYSYLKKPTWRTIILAGCSLGLGLISKYSLLLLGPTFIILLGMWLLYQHRQSNPVIPSIFTKLRSTWQRYTLGLVTIFIISWACVWAAYGTLILINPAQNPTSITNVTQVPSSLAKITPYVLPVMYAKGAAILFDPNSHGRDGYLLGACYKGGLWDYFPILTIFKAPLPVLGLFLCTCFIWLKRRKSIGFTPLIFLVAIGLYGAFCMSSNINIGFRHILPAYALLLVIAAYPFSLINWREQAKRFGYLVSATIHRLHALRQSRDNVDSQSPKHFPTLPPLHSFTLPTLLLACLVAIVASASFAYPNYLSYFNILSGEPRNIPFISGDSNVDWGQGTKQLEAYMQQHHIQTIAFDNFIGTGEANYRHMSLVAADPNNHNYQGYLALSRSTITDHMCTQNDNWGWITHHLQPIAIIGGSINLYKLE
jgi:hypothetical protein